MKFSGGFAAYMSPECIPQTGQVLPNYPDRRLRRIRIISHFSANFTDIVICMFSLVIFCLFSCSFRFALQTDNLPEHYTPHSLRATAASMWYVNGVSEKTIQSLLGHTTIQMTMRYCHDLTTMDEKRNAMTLAMAVNS